MNPLKFIQRWLQRRRRRQMSVIELIDDFQDIQRGRKLRQRSLENWCAGQAQARRKDDK